MPPKRKMASATSNAKRQRRRRRVTNGSRASSNGSTQASGFTPWFPIQETAITSATNPGPLHQAVLHPKNFPSTPYYNAMNNFAFREEGIWEAQVVITAASLTGARVAVYIDPDLSLDPREPSRAQVLGWVQNGIGLMVSATGTGTQAGRLRHGRATTQLSNSTPTGMTVLGFAVGSLTVYLLDPPIGISQTVNLQLSVLARVQVRGILPANGFMDLEPPWPPLPGPGPAPGPAYEIRCDFSKGSEKADKKVPQVPHTGDMFLAPGNYWLTAQKDGFEWKVRDQWMGAPLPWHVYQCEEKTKNWENDLGEKALKPQYFAVYESDAGSWQGLVGFEGLRDAIQCCTAPQLVPTGAACCVTFDAGEPKAEERFEGLKNDTVHLRLAWAPGLGPARLL